MGAQAIGWFWMAGSSVDGSLADGLRCDLNGAVAQLGEHLLCKQGVSGSIPLSSTKVLVLMRVGYPCLWRNKSLHRFDEALPVLLKL